MRARSWVIATVLFCCTYGFCDNLSTKKQLDAKEQQLEQLWAEFWRTQYAIDSGEHKDASVQPVRAKINAVLLDDTFLQRLRSTHFLDPVLRRRRELFIADADDARINGDPDLVKLLETITKDESEARYTLDGRTLTRAELNNILGHEQKRELREKAWTAQRQITQVTGERIQKAMKMRLALARKNGVGNYTDFMLKRKGLDRKELLAWFEEIRRETQPEYDALLRTI